MARLAKPKKRHPRG
ncbi:hypothetical protein YPPY36_3062, partial [Yersinia pestis PY-36]